MLSDGSLRGIASCQAILEGADLKGADLCYVDLHQANLDEADLSNAKLQAAKLNRASLRGANLEGANLTNADLYKVNLRGARNVTEEQLSKLNEATVRTHIGNILSKLHLAIRVQATLYALRKGLSTLKDVENT